MKGERALGGARCMTGNDKTKNEDDEPRITPITRIRRGEATASGGKGETRKRAEQGAARPQPMRVTTKATKSTKKKKEEEEGGGRASFLHPSVHAEGI